MAKARMLHKKISLSMQVNDLSLSAQLLFTWMISHPDDEGKLRGEPKYIRATVVPLKNWSITKVENCINEMKNAGLIYYWQQNNKWIIEFISWFDHQKLRKDRSKKSKLPSYCDKKDNQTATSWQPTNNQMPVQANVSEPNKREDNKSEYNFINPKLFQSTTKEEVAALDTWKRLEPNNPAAFQSTYLRAVKLGLQYQKFYEFSSEIKQDFTIKNQGAVFNKKVEEYLKTKKG